MLKEPKKMMRCSQCKKSWKPVSMYNHATKSVDTACSDCLDDVFIQIMTLAAIDFDRIEQEVNGNV